jgi:hypothetical protein
MKKILYTLMVSLVFTAFQVSTVVAQDPIMDARMADEARIQAERQAEDVAKNEARQAEDTATQASRQKDDEDRHAAWMKEDEERFAAGAPTGGDDGPPIDPRTITPENPAGTPFTQADEVKYQIYADECETSGGKISAASLALLINDGFTEEMVNGLCQMSANEVDCRIHPAGPARDACLAN